MRQESTHTDRDLEGPPRRWWALTYPNRQHHGVLASLFPRSYGQFLLVGLAGKAIFLLALACGFVIVAAFAAGRQDRAFLYAMPLVGMGFSAYELLALSRARLLDRTLRPIQPGSVAVLILALSGACFLLSVSPIGWTAIH
jgi:hypothetical protein